MSLFPLCLHGNREKCYICQALVPVGGYGRHTELCIQQQEAKVLHSPGTNAGIPVQNNFFFPPSRRRICCRLWIKQRAEPQVSHAAGWLLGFTGEFLKMSSCVCRSETERIQSPAWVRLNPTKSSRCLNSNLIKTRLCCHTGT